jgi:hypothetical protein
LGSGHRCGVEVGARQARRARCVRPARVGLGTFCERPRG